MAQLKERAATIDAFIGRSGWKDAARQVVAGDASARRYLRLRRSPGKSVILMDAPPETGETVDRFILIAEHLRANGLSAPEIFEADTVLGLLLIEDFGHARFAELMVGNPAQERPLYRDAIDVLLHLRDTPVPALEMCDRDWLTTMLKPFFEWYAPGCDARDRVALLAAFRPFAEAIETHLPVLMLRDFHAENLMALPDRDGPRRVGLLDFQDAMQAHPAYDLVSILQDARRDVKPDIEEEMLARYIAASGEVSETFRRDYALLGLQRNLRILGIFARLSQRDGKDGYLDFVPRVRGYVMRNLAHPALSDLAPLARRCLRDTDLPTQRQHSADA